MCGRFGLFASRDDVETRYGVQVPLSVWDGVPRYNIAPSQPVLGVVAGPEAATLRWGLIPAATPPGLRPGRVAPARGREWINARVETVATKQAFRTAFATRRCLVPASGYYEWEGAEAPPGPDEPFQLTPPSARRPHWHGRRGEPLFSMAGIVASWEPEPGVESIESVAIVTTDAVPGVASVHPRMPLVLPRARESEWLERAPTPDQLVALVGEAAQLSWVSRVVGDAVNSPRNEGASLINPR